jgi:hypothetical protein
MNKIKLKANKQGNAGALARTLRFFTGKSPVMLSHEQNLSSVIV